MATVAVLSKPWRCISFLMRLKTGPEWQVDGTAIYYALHLDDMILGSLSNGALAQDGAAYPLRLVAELLGPVLIFCPWFNSTFRYVFFSPSSV